MPTSSVKRLLNEPRLEKPTNMQISVTVRLAWRKQILGPLHPSPRQVLSRRLPIGVLEGSGEVELGEATLGGQPIEVQGLRELPVHEITSLAQVPDPFSGRHGRDSDSAPGEVQELALRVGVGRAIEGRTEAARTAHGFAEPGDHPGAVFDRARIERLGLTGGPGQVPGVDHRVRTGQVADQFAEAGRSGEGLYFDVRPGPGRVRASSSAALASLHCANRSPSGSAGVTGPPNRPSTRRWVLTTWATRSRTVHSSQGVGSAHWSGLTPCSRSVKPLETRA